MNLRILLFISLLLLPCSCFASEDEGATGNRVLDYCTAAVHALDNGTLGTDMQSAHSFWCLGFVNGVKDTLMMARALPPDTPAEKVYPGLYPCLPDEGISSSRLFG